MAQLDFSMPISAWKPCQRRAIRSKPSIVSYRGDCKRLSSFGFSLEFTNSEGALWPFVFFIASSAHCLAARRLDGRLRRAQ